MPRPRLLHPIRLAVVLTLLAAGVARAEEDAAARPHAIDLVVCLDTSGSMEGLIDQARNQLWKLVGDLSRLEPEPDLRVALLTYGSPGDADVGHVVLRVGLTTDLDLLYEQLFALRTSGGAEYVGRVVATALDDLTWARGGAMRTIFVAGNESADQDREVPFREALARAAEHGIVVNAVYCGGPDDAHAAGWREVARLGKGRFSHIDHDGAPVTIATPFDEELGALSTRLNATYLFHGRDGDGRSARQAAQDHNAAGAGLAVAAERAQAKASGLYRPDADLVSGFAEGTIRLADLEGDRLPEVLRPLDEAGRRAHLERLAQERAEIQAHVRELGRKREAYLREAQPEGSEASRALGAALWEGLRAQATAAGFR
jgi:hypothetical protein